MSDKDFIKNKIEPYLLNIEKNKKNKTTSESKTD